MPQRIVVLREQARLKATGETPKLLRELEEEYRLQGEGTCAADGLCATRCPVDIDTRAMMKRLRAGGQGEKAQKVGNWVERNMGGATAASRAGLRTVSTLLRLTGPGVLEKTSSGLRSLTGYRVPTWDRWMPRATSRIRIPVPTAAPAGKVVYLPSCASRTMGHSGIPYRSILSLIDACFESLQSGP